MGSWCSSGRSQDVIVTTPHPSPLLESNQSGSFDFISSVSTPVSSSRPPPLNVGEPQLDESPGRITSKTQFVPVKWSPVFANHSSQRSQLKSPSDSTSTSPSDTPRKRTRVTFAIPPPPPGLPPTTYSSHDQTCDIPGDTGTPPSISHDWSCERTRSDSVLSSLSCDSADVNQDLVTVTVLESSFSSVSSVGGVPVMIERRGFNAAKAVQIHHSALSDVITYTHVNVQLEVNNCVLYSSGDSYKYV